METREIKKLLANDVPKALRFVEENRESFTEVEMRNWIDLLINRRDDVVQVSVFRDEINFTLASLESALAYKVG